MVEPAEDGVGHEVAVFHGGLGFSERGVWIWDPVYPLVDASSAIPFDHLGQHKMQMALVPDEQMIEALATQGPDEALHVRGGDHCRMHPMRRLSADASG